ncbi:MAG: N-acetylmuramoyl-L-alanine amidase [Deltaproteobacteria bacterium]|nr:N-acetylmuramoyl-L-alanine amidase [Deltaproteobacteria bacterium]
MRAAAVVGGVLAASAGARADPEILDRPIRFDAERIELSKDYLRQHYGLQVEDLRIVPKAVVIHWTGTARLEPVWRGFNRVRLRAARRYLVRGGHLNVSAHFLVDRDGTIYRLMPETWMARHCIGLNYDAIGIENVGGVPGAPLTREQLDANAALLAQLVRRHPIRYLLGHFEWRRFEGAPFFRERDPTYRNAKADPGPEFMRQLRRQVAHLGLRGRYAPTDDSAPVAR